MIPNEASIGEDTTATSASLKGQATRDFSFDLSETQVAVFLVKIFHALSVSIDRQVPCAVDYLPVAFSFH